MNKKVLIVIIIALVALIISRTSIKVSRPDFIQQTDSLRKEIKAGNAVIDSLDAVIANTPVPPTPQEVKQYIEEAYDKRIRTIRTLPTDSAFIFFSGWVSKEDTTGY